MEINLENGKRKYFKEKYGTSVTISKEEDNYYVICDKVRHGPFAKIAVERVGKGESKDILLITINPGKTDFYRIQYDGLKLLDSEDWNYELSVGLIQKVSNDEEILKQDPTCISLKKVSGYSIFVDKNDKFFAVNNTEKAQSIESYPHFDSYMDLVRYYRGKYCIKLHHSDIRYLTDKNADFINIDEIKALIDDLKEDDLSKETKDFVKLLEHKRKVDIEYARNILQYEIINNSYIEQVWANVIIKKAHIKEIKKYRLSSDLKKDLEKKGYIHLPPHKTLYSICKYFPSSGNKIANYLYKKMASLTITEQNVPKNH